MFQSNALETTNRSEPSVRSQCCCNLVAFHLWCVKCQVAFADRAVPSDCSVSGCRSICGETWEGRGQCFSLAPSKSAQGFGRLVEEPSRGDNSCCQAETLVQESTFNECSPNACRRGSRISDCSVGIVGSCPWRRMRSLRMTIGRVGDYCMEIVSGVDDLPRSSECDRRQRGVENPWGFI